MRHWRSRWLNQFYAGMLIVFAWAALPGRGFSQGGPPRILTSPSNVIALVGDSADFTVVVHESTSILTYSWFLGGTRIPDATYATLTLPVVRSGMVGAYSAVVTNVSGSATSSPAYLTAVSPPFPIKQFVRPGEDATFGVSVHAVPASGQVEYQWLFNGDPLPGQNDATLTITNAQWSDGGPYAVTVTITKIVGDVKDVRDVTTPEAMLVVQEEPPPPRLSCIHWGTNGPVFKIFGTPNVTYVIQASTDFNSWSDISTNIAPDTGKIEFFDPDSANFPWRSYRVLKP